MVSLYYLFAALGALASGTLAQDLVLAQSRFNSGSFLDPFYECTFRRPSYAQVVNGELEVFLDEANYDGTRLDRGIKMCADTRPVVRELWQGFSLMIPSDYSHDKQSIIAQNFCHGGCSSWCGTLDIEGNSLRVDHRYACADSATTTATIIDDLPRDEWVDVVINARFSAAKDGHYTVYWNGRIIYNAQGINLGFDSAWTADGAMTNGVGFKN